VRRLDDDDLEDEYEVDIDSNEDSKGKGSGLKVKLLDPLSEISIPAVLGLWVKKVECNLHHFYDSNNVSIVAEH
jgi:hypothetical protein